MKIPFELKRTDGVSLVRQLADAIREAISCGDYRPGEILPTRAEFAAVLKVSERIPREAEALLAAEGIVYTRRCLGCVVSEQKTRRWNGKVLYVESQGLASYYYSALSASFRQALTEAGYLVSTVMCPADPKGQVDLRPLEDALRQKWTFVVLPFVSPKVVKAVEEAGIDYLVAGRGNHRGRHCVETFAVDSKQALRDLASACVARGIRTVSQISLAGEVPFLDMRPLAAEYGLSVTALSVRAAHLPLSLESISLASMRAIGRRLAASASLPDLIFFTDDYLAAGGLVALLAVGVKVPETLRVVTLTNRGNCPPFPVPLARIEIDPVENGIALAVRVLKRLKRKTGRLPVAAYRFIDGESLG